MEKDPTRISSREMVLSRPTFVWRTISQGMAIMTQNISAAKVRQDGVNCPMQARLFRPPFYRTHGRNNRALKGRNNMFPKRWQLFLCVIDIWRMV